MDVRGRAVVITGASRGIGKQLAIEMGRLGANIVVGARSVEPHRRLAGTIGDTVAAVVEAGGQALAVRTDLGEPSDIAALIRQTVDRFGGIDVLVNNAADTSGGTASITDLTREDWLSQFATNLHGPFSLIQGVIPYMVERGGGVIVNMTSGAADLVPPVPNRAAGSDGIIRIGERLAYGASKAALNRLGNMIAPQLQQHGIAVVTIDPGFTKTELVDLMAERGLVDPRMAVPMETPVKTVVHVITSDDPMQFTGQILRAAPFVQEHGL